MDSRLRAFIAVVSADVAALKAAGGGGQVPTFVAADKVYRVPADTQALFTVDIDVEGVVDVDGVLVEV